MALQSAVASHCLFDSSSSLFQRLCLGGAAQIAVGARQVPQRDGHVGVVGSQRGLGDPQRPLLQRQCLGGAAQIAVGGRQVPQRDGHVGVVGS